MPNAKQTLQSEVEARYVEMTPGSIALFKEAQDALPGGDTRNAAYMRPHPLYIDYGAGAYVFDVDGNRLLDCSTNMSSVMHGHAHPAIVEAVTEQVARGTAWTAANSAAPKLAALLKERIPSVERVRFANSGTEAVMLAVRAARAFTGRSKVAKCVGAYHGSHDDFDASPGTIPTAKDHIVEFEFNDAESVTRVLEEHGDEMAALIVEPLLSAGGMIPPAEGFLQHLRDETEKRDVLLIFDEVISLRASLGGSQELFGVVPDLTAMGKIIGGGFPVGAFGGRADVMDQFSPLNEHFLHHSGTFNGNPVTMVAGIAALRELDADTMAYVNRLGERLSDAVGRAANAQGVTVQVTGAGSLRNLHFTAEPPTTVAEARASDPWLMRLLHLKLVTEGVLMATRGMFALSTVSSEQDIDGAVDKIGAALDWMRPAIEERAPALLS